MATDDHGIEVLKKSGKEVVPGSKADYCLQVCNADGDVIDISGTIVPSGLTTGGKITKLTITATPAALPATPLANRNTLSIQNQDATNSIFINYVSSFTDGWEIYAGGYKEIPITDSIIIYGKTASGTADVIIDEIA